MKEIIRKRREFFQPSEVKPYKVPKWLIARIYPKVKSGEIDEPITRSDGCLLETAVKAAGGSGLWFDHYGTTYEDGFELFVCEPYEIDVEGAKRFADLLGLKFAWFANSWWFPGETFRVLFIPGHWEIHEEKGTPRIVPINLYPWAVPLCGGGSRKEPNDE